MVAALSKMQRTEVTSLTVSCGGQVRVVEPTEEVTPVHVPLQSGGEHAIIKERVTAGVRQAITKRNLWSRCPVEGVDPTVTTTVLRLKKQGLGYHRIGQKLGLSSRTVWKV